MAKCNQSRNISKGFGVLFTPAFHLFYTFEIFQNRNLGNILRVHNKSKSKGGSQQ